VPLPRVEPGNVANIDVSADGTRLVFSSRTIPTCDLSAPSPFPPLSLSATVHLEAHLDVFEHRT
jgi:hypothetical protein